MLATLAACHTTKPVAERQQPTDTTPVQPTATPLPAPTAPRELTVINFNAVVEGTSMTGQLRMANDSIIWLSLTKIIELGRAIATPDSVFINIPIAGKHFAGNYTDVEHIAKQPVSFAALQQMATANDAEQQIEQLAQRMGLSAKVQITRRQKAQRLTFPFSR